MQHNVEKFREKANNLMLDKKYDELISLCDEKLSELKGKTQEEREILAIACQLKGNVFYINKDFESAEEYYIKSIKYNPNYAKLYYNLGILKMELEKYEEAIELFTKSIELQPDYENAYYSRGQAKESLGLKSEALEDYKKKEELKQNSKESVKIVTNPDGSSMEYHSNSAWVMWQSHILFKTKDGTLIKKEMFYDMDFKFWGVTTEYFWQEDGSCIERDKVDNRRLLTHGDVDFYYVKRVKDTQGRVVLMEYSLDKDFGNIRSKNLCFYGDDGSRTEYEYWMEIQTPEQIEQAGLFPARKSMYNSSEKLVGTIDYYDFDCKRPALIRTLEYLDDGTFIDKGVYPEKHPFGKNEHSYIHTESSGQVSIQNFSDTNFTDLIESTNYENTEYGYIKSTFFTHQQRENALELTYKSVRETKENPIAQEEYCKKEYYSDENFNNICCVYEYKMHWESNVDFSCERRAVYTELEENRDFLSLIAQEDGSGKSNIYYYYDNNFEKLAKKQVQTPVNSNDNNNIINVEASWYDEQGNLINSENQDFYI